VVDELSNLLIISLNYITKYSSSVKGIARLVGKLVLEEVGKLLLNNVYKGESRVNLLFSNIFNLNVLRAIVEVANRINNVATI
jgi:hypothetical protein